MNTYNDRLSLIKAVLNYTTVLIKISGDDEEFHEKTKNLAAEYIVNTLSPKVFCTVHKEHEIRYFDRMCDECLADLEQKEKRHEYYKKQLGK